MTRKYFINYWRNFANTYNLAYTETPEQEQEALSFGYERITRKEAVRLARAENRRRIDDPSSAYYSDNVITPWGYDGDLYNDPHMIIVDCIAERI